MVEAPPATILVVDDNEANRALARSTLEDEGYSVVLATNGAEGIEAFTRTRPDCVLLDVRMPEVDGFTACERIRGLPHGAETPVIFLTALRDVDTLDRAVSAGADDFLTKPVRPSELVVRVQTALKIRQLGAELREQYELLKHQRDDLLRVQLQKERLMAFIVHDLKNPVNTMDLHAQVLLRDRSLSESARESATHIRAAAKHLNGMILNLLDIGKADEGKLVLEATELELPGLLGEIFGDLTITAQAAGVELVSTVDVERIRADRNLLRRMLGNLIENALRHAPRGTAVQVAFAARSTEIELCVTDAGPGVPEHLRDKIFDPFVQLDDGKRSRSGRGLGLTFCKLAAEAHGGRIWVEDAAPGAAFRVRLPR